MMERRDEAQLPPEADIRAALRRTTARLVEELNAPQATPPVWSEFEWRVAMAVAAMHGVAGLLAGRLRWHGHEVWEAFLQEQLTGTLRRLERIRALHARLDAAAREAGVAMQALKGSALIQLELYADGERPMSDVDLLVRPAQFETAAHLIEGLGFVPGAQVWKHREYVPVEAGDARAFGEHEANPVKIDLHSRIAERLPRREVEITERLFPQSAEPGLQIYPTLSALLRHLLLHAAGNLCDRSVRLIHLHDIAQFATRLAPADWEALFADGVDWWLYPPLLWADRCLPGRIPAAVLERAAAICPADLRRHMRACQFEEVLVSRFTAPALPGLAWVGSPRELLAYLKTRIYPGREASAQLRKAARGLDALQTTRWGRMPRWQRALQWVGGAPPRAITMYSVQRALQHRPSSTTSA